ncbi:hypothetical protein HK098_001057 [Nowakowskiella sp. JEL0407]|nr:hypothetical protein HK098_001057 [Nowakowskiella sp. JEL0407]
MAENTVLVTVLEGRYFQIFPGKQLQKVYIQCRFNNEILTTDPVTLTSSPIWDTELAWDLPSKLLHFFRSQRASLKLICYSLNPTTNARDSLGFIMLDLRTAVSFTDSTPTNAASIEKWYPLVNSKIVNGRRPEVKLSFAVGGKGLTSETVLKSSSLYIQQQEKQRMQQLGASQADQKPKETSVSVSKNDQTNVKPEKTPTPVRTHPSKDQRQSLVTKPKFSLPVSITNAGVFQIGSPPYLPNIYTLKIIISFAEHLNLLVATQPNPNTLYHFDIVFNAQRSTLSPFPELSNPKFASEQISIRFIVSSVLHLGLFLQELGELSVYLCEVETEYGRENDDKVLGVATAPLHGLVINDSHGGVKVGNVVEQVRPMSRIGVQPLSMIVNYPGIGISMAITEESEIEKNQNVSNIASKHQNVNNEGTPSQPLNQQPQQPSFESSFPTSKLPKPDFSKYNQPATFDHNSTTTYTTKPTSDSKKIEERPVLVQPYEGSPPRKRQSPARFSSPGRFSSPSPLRDTKTRQHTRTASTPKAEPVISKPEPRIPTQWRQYRFSIELQSLRNFKNVYSRNPSSIFLRYTYTPFGSSPFQTHPPVLVPAVPLTTKQEIPFSNAFCSFEFIMSPDRLITYLEAVPLIVEVWGKDIEGNKKDVKIGIVQIDMNGVWYADKRIVEVDGDHSFGKDKKQAEMRVDDRWNDVVTERGERIGGLRVLLALEDFGGVEDIDSVDVKNDKLLKLKMNSQSSEKPLRDEEPKRRLSIHDTEEYRAALELELWKAEEQAKFQKELAKTEQATLARLEEEYEKREKDRQTQIAKRINDFRALEKQMETLIGELEIREKRVEKMEVEVIRRKEDLEHEFNKKLEETRDAARRLHDEYKHKMEIERQRANENDAARLRIARERDELENRLKKLEEEFVNWKRKNLTDAPEIALKIELSEMKAENSLLRGNFSNMEKLNKELRDRSRLQAKTIKKLNEAFKFENEREEKLKQAKAQSETKSESSAIHDQSQLDAIKKEIEALKSAKWDPPSTNAPAKERLNPTTSWEIERLISERDALIKTALYSNEDTLIREFDLKIKNLLSNNNFN